MTARSRPAAPSSHVAHRPWCAWVATLVCMGASALAWAQTSGPIPASCAMADFDAQMLAAVNAARATARSCGGKAMSAQGPLASHPQLISAAVRHSRDMATRRQLGHHGSDGTRSADRVTASGYDWNMVAENVAWNQRSVAEVMRSWLGSPGHCLNIMEPNAVEFGAACAVDAGGATYWTQVFGRRSSTAAAPATSTPAATTTAAHTPATTAAAAPAATPPRNVQHIDTCGPRDVPEKLLAEWNRLRAQPTACAGTPMPTAGTRLTLNGPLMKAASGYSQTLAQLPSNAPRPTIDLSNSGYRFVNVGTNSLHSESDYQFTMEWMPMNEGVCRHLLNPKFTDLGVACQRSSTGGAHWTLLFGQPAPGK